MMTERNARQSPVWRGINRVGLWTLFVKESERFLNVYSQTLIAPLVTMALFFSVFALTLGGAAGSGGGHGDVGGIPYLDFLAPGLVMMTMVQNAFVNSSSSLVISKIQGNIVDVLMPPISPVEFVTAYAAASTLRGIMLGALGLLTLAPFVHVELAHPLAALYFGASGSLMLGVIGILTGIWSEKFDHLSGITSFVITPLAFLSGTFYSPAQLPQIWQTLIHANPFFHMIDGFRYGVTGHADGDPLTGALALAAVNAVLLLVCWRVVVSGYRLKS